MTTASSMLLGIAAGLLGCAIASAQTGLAPSACPTGIAADVSCWRGRDANGAHLLVARPRDWSGVLVVHTFGGPRLAAPSATTTDEDLLRFAEFLREGHAWVSTSRRRAGFGVRQGADDADNARKLAIDLVGAPRLTIAHGQSWGAAVTAKLIETLNEPGANGRRPYDAALLTSGVLAGGSRAYDMRMDLRAAFQAICGTHPRSDEPQYHLGIGLPPEASLPSQELAQRLRACTGLGDANRSEAQARAARDLAAASRIPERALPGHLAWATFTFQDIARNLTGGRSPFGNATVRYRGTSDDDAFNARVPRFTADPEAARRLAEDSDLSGRVAIPTLSLHAIHDEIAFVEHQAAYRAVRVAAGTDGLLAQVFIDEGEHSKMSAPLYPAAMRALLRWVETGARPNAAIVLGRCEEARAVFPGACRIAADYAVRPWAERINPR